ncbi:uncharacterized protein LOC123531789 isoform X2 [Mercenaria mercenaria]|uniref:uncharacterized protein LOC123531789 isoform X2 n=1 Tax=Mercenaria mercenaria TaxID=6596 RepID=UPI00234F4BAF|nr:uncharacterized protein LOC123531789 isoform X2 [Mercenaria mercenaria]
MHADIFFPSKDALDSDKKMSVRRDFICGQLFGVLLVCAGFVGGIIVGIYVYHGGPDSEVTCKNLPDWLKDGEKTTKYVQTKYTTTSPSTVVTEMEKKTFTYTINNQIQEPYFNNSVTMEIENHNPLIYYMEKSVDEDPEVFTRFKTTYFSQLGYFIDSINSIAGNFADDKTYWQIFNNSGPLKVA